MNIPAAYLTVVLIWSTTPLGIKWSSLGVGYEFGVAARMVIGLIALFSIVRLRRLPMPWDRHSIYVYMASGLPLFAAMSAVYWAGQYIPSGWISVIYGLSPLFTSALAMLILKSNGITLGRLSGMLLGLVGLGVVFAESLSVSRLMLLGVMAVTFSALSQSFGAVMIKRLNPGLHPISITTGGLVISVPLFIMNFLMNTSWPETVPLTTFAAIVYLAIMGTTIGFPLYFYLLKNINADRVALIALITPVTALLLGAWLNDESISQRVWLGTALILTGLCIYEYGRYLPLAKRWGLRWIQRPL